MPKTESISLDFLVSFALIICLLGCEGRQYPPPGIYLSPNIFDYGLAEDQSHVEGEFQVVNTTKSPVRITNTEASCGCTEVILENRVIPAGESILLRLRADVKGRYGRHAFDVLLLTDNKSVPALRAQLSGHIATTKVEGRSMHRIGSFAPGGKISETLRIPKGAATSVQVANLKHSGEQTLTAEISRDLGDFLECQLSGLAPKSEGRFNTTILLTADEKSDWKQQTILATGDVKSRWRYQKKCYLGFVSLGEFAKKTIQIEDQFSNTLASTENPIVSAKIDSTTGHIDAKASLDESGVVSVTLILKKTKEHGPISEKVGVMLTTSNHQEHFLELEVLGHVLDK